MRTLKYARFAILTLFYIHANSNIFLDDQDKQFLSFKIYLWYKKVLMVKKMSWKLEPW